MALERDLTARRSGSLLRPIVLILATLELGAAAYVFWALFLDDTTAWIVTIVPDLDEIWRQLILPSAVAGALAALLAFLGRGLWFALAIALAGPLVTVWLLA